MIGYLLDEKIFGHNSEKAIEFENDVIFTFDTVVGLLLWLVLYLMLRNLKK